MTFPTPGPGNLQTLGPRIGNSGIRRLSYPSPFFDLSSTYLPKNVKELFKQCEFYYMTNPLINAAIWKMAEYPVTDIVLDLDDEEVKKKWEILFDKHLGLEAFLISVGLDYFCFGNAFVTISFPFTKFLKCKSCGAEFNAEMVIDDWTFHNYKFRFKKCPNCKGRTEAVSRDIYFNNIPKLRLIRWDPKRVLVMHNRITGHSYYFYLMPPTENNDLQLGRKHVVVQTPTKFIQAAKEGKPLQFLGDSIFHLKRPIISGHSDGYGMPLMMPVLKDTFLLQILKKSTETIAVEHIVPLRVIFPQSASAQGNVVQNVQLSRWRDQIYSELTRWRRDCVSPGTFVETIDGLKKADQVHEGDLIIDHTGSPTAVEKKWVRPLRPGEKSYSMKVRGLRAIESVYSEEHPIWAARKFNNGNGHKVGTPEFIKIKDLRRGDYVGYPIDRAVEPTTFIDLAQHTNRKYTDSFVYTNHERMSCVPDIFEHLEKYGNPPKRGELLREKSWTLNQYKAAQNAVCQHRTLRRVPRHIPIDEELAWVLGIYLAEGSTTPKQVFFALHKEESYIISRLDRFFEDRFGVRGFTHHVSENGIQRVYSNVPAAQMFHNLCPGLAKTKRVPKILMKASDEIVCSLLQGMVDGDGHNYDKPHEKKKLVYNTSSIQMAEDVRKLFLSLGVVVGITKEDKHEYCIAGRRGKAFTSYRIQASGTHCKRFWAMARGEEYPGTVWSRIGFIRDGYMWHRIDAVEEEPTDTVIGFSVSNDTFCTWGVATHNSNYMPIMPYPVGFQSIGGDGKALMLSQEIGVWSEQILAGMGVCREMIYGGLSFSGSNVSLRMMEVSFLNYRNQLMKLVDWVTHKLHLYLDWDEPRTRLKDFKMADDLQRKMYVMQLNQMQKVSDTTLLSESDFDRVKEDELMQKELADRLQILKKNQLAQAEIQGEMGITAARYQVKTQTEMANLQQEAQAKQQYKQQEQQQAAQGAMAMGQNPLALVKMNPELAFPQPTLDIRKVPFQIAEQMEQMEPAEAEKWMTDLSERFPDLASLVRQAREIGLGGSLMKPLPEQLPPRREASPI